MPGSGRGRFLVLEGIDGSGKSSTLRHAVQVLRDQGRDVVATREETETELGGWVRKSVADRVEPLATAFLFMADRAQHVREIEAWLRQGRTVLCDRYVHSTLAYQSVTLQGVVPDPVGFLTRMHEGWCPMPDKVLLFRADPARSVERTQARGARTPYEKTRFLQQVQDNYLRMAAGDPRFTVLDAERPIDVVKAEATERLLRWTS